MINCYVHTRIIEIAILTYATYIFSFNTEEPLFVQTYSNTSNLNILLGYQFFLSVLSMHF